MMRVLRFCVAGFALPAVITSLATLPNDTRMERRRALQSIWTLPVITTIAASMPEETRAVGEKDSVGAVGSCQTRCVYQCQSSDKQKDTGTGVSCEQRCESTDSKTTCRKDAPHPQVREPQLQQSRAIPGLYRRWQDDDTTTM